MIENNFKYIISILFILILKFEVVNAQTVIVSSFIEEQNKEELKYWKKHNEYIAELQSKKEQSNDLEEEVFVVVREKKQFCGRDAEIEFRRYIERFIKYPREAIKKDIEGTIIVKFNVDRCGRVEETHILRGVDPILNNEVIRTINSSPKWTPTRARGPVFNSTYVLVIDFRLIDKKKILFKGDIPEIGFSRYIKENIKYPKEALDKEIEGCVFVRFTITNKGEVTNTHILRGSNYFLNKEAIRVINSSPKWNLLKRRKFKEKTYVFPVLFKKNQTQIN